jgi:hypothetical protein
MKFWKLFWKGAVLYIKLFIDLLSLQAISGRAWFISRVQDVRFWSHPLKLLYVAMHHGSPGWQCSAILGGLKRAVVLSHPYQGANEKSLGISRMK